MVRIAGELEAPRDESPEPPPFPGRLRGLRPRRAGGRPGRRRLGPAAGAAAAPAPGPPPLRAADYRRVAFADPFWAPRQKTNRETTVPHLFRKLREVGAIENLERSGAGLRDGHKGYVFADSDVHKTLEAAAYCLGAGSDPAIARETDAVIAVLRQAQRPTATWTRPTSWADARFSNLRDDHELYCAGHLVEAGVAHFQATGRRDLARDRDPQSPTSSTRTFGDGPERAPATPAIPSSSSRSCSSGGRPASERYFQLAQFFLEHRGELLREGAPARPPRSTTGPTGSTT